MHVGFSNILSLLLICLATYRSYLSKFSDLRRGCMKRVQVQYKNMLEAIIVCHLVFIRSESTTYVSNSPVRQTWEINRTKNLVAEKGYASCGKS